jgi:DNA helicase-2/ATP-dependent DNA helicase PcrA
VTVVLHENYRSVQPILDVSKTLIDRNLVRLVNKRPGLTKHLTSSNKEIQGFHYPPEIREYETQGQEMIGIVMEVDKLLQEGESPASITVIYKENKYGLELAQYCKLKNIPVYSKRSLNVLEIPLAQKIITVCSYLATEHDIPYSGDEMLFEILHFDWFQIPPIEIAKLSVEVAERYFKENKISLRRLLFEKANEPGRDLFSVPIHPGLKAASAIIEQLIADVPNLTLQMLLENLIRNSGLLKQVMQSTEKIWMLQVVTALFDFIKEETHRNPTLKLKDLVNIVETMNKEGLPLPLVEVSGSEKGVNLLTVHGSKGLEYKYVFFAGCNSAFWEKKRKPSTGYKLPDNLFANTSDKDAKDDDEELRRLFYVAMTRAALHLYMSYSKYINDGKELEPSMFIEEIQAVHRLPVIPISFLPETIAEFQLLQLEGRQAPEIEKMEEEYVSQLLSKFVMNVTALNNYLKCPLEFYFKNLIRIPSPKNEATEFGSAVHTALEQLFRTMQTNPDQSFPSSEQFVSWFDGHMKRHRESFTNEQFIRRMEYGHQVLPEYYNRSVNQWNKIVAIERNIRNVQVRGVPLKGKLDKLEFDGKLVNIVDYKTGDPDKAKAKLTPPNAKDPNGGDYWRQAVFYKILIDHFEQRGWQAISTEFDFIEPDNKKNYKKAKLIISPEDITTVTQQIVETWEKIQRHQFYVGCGKADCHWCNFVKTNQLNISLHELNEEAQEIADLRDN